MRWGSDTTWAHTEKHQLKVWRTGATNELFCSLLTNSRPFWSPVYKDSFCLVMKYHIFVLQVTRAISQKIRGLQHRARAVLSLGNTVFVDPMVCFSLNHLLIKSLRYWWSAFCELLIHFTGFPWLTATPMSIIVGVWMNDTHKKLPVNHLHWHPQHSGCGYNIILSGNSDSLSLCLLFNQQVSLPWDSSPVRLG